MIGIRFILELNKEFHLSKLIGHHNNKNSTYWGEIDDSICIKLIFTSGTIWLSIFTMNLMLITIKHFKAHDKWKKIKIKQFIYEALSYNK